MKPLFKTLETTTTINAMLTAIIISIAVFWAISAHASLN